MALDETIAELVRRQAARPGRPAAAADARAAWCADVDAVMDEVRSTLQPFTEAGAASVSSEPVDVTEELIGTYPAQRLVLAVAGRRILVEPVARYTFGGTGRIDMYRETRPSEEERLFILRPADLPDGARAPWLIETRRPLPPGVPAGAGEVGRGLRRYVPLDRAGIEGALDHLLTMA